MAQAKQPLNTKQLNKVEPRQPLSTQIKSKILVTNNPSQSSALGAPFNPTKASHLQRTIGNQALGKFGKALNPRNSNSFGSTKPHDAELLQLDKTVLTDAKDASQSPGQSLNVEMRRSMEKQFGYDFSQVHVHTDSKANQAANSLDAKAYTIGNDIVFANGEFTPHTREGQDLLQHELAHVVQMEVSGSTLDTTRLSPANHPSEQQAEAALQNPSSLKLDIVPAGIALARRKKRRIKEDVTTKHFGNRQGYRRTEHVFNRDEKVNVNQRGTYEQEREMNIARGASHAKTRCLGYLTAYKIDIMNAVNDFKESAQDQIEDMDGTPSGYWGLLPIAAGVIGGLVTSFIPGANIAIGIAIATGVQAAIQLTVTEEVSSARGNAKQNAIRAMSKLAKGASKGVTRGLHNIEKPLEQELLNLSILNDKARLLLETGDDDSIDRFILQYFGVRNPKNNLIYQPIRTSLESEFAQWLARQKNLSALETEREVSRAESRAKQDALERVQ